MYGGERALHHNKKAKADYNYLIWSRLEYYSENKIRDCEEGRLL